MINSSATAFVVIDLVSQASAFSRFVSGWSKEEVLRWLNVYGEIESFYIPYAVTSPIHRFNSRFGFSTSFYLEGNQFTFFGDNST